MYDFVNMPSISNKSGMGGFNLQDLNVSEENLDTLLFQVL